MSAHDLGLAHHKRFVSGSLSAESMMHDQHVSARSTQYIDWQPYISTTVRKYTYCVSHRGIHEPHADCPSSLRCFPDLDTRPTMATSILVRCAILGSETRRLSVKDIILALQTKFPYFGTIVGTCELERSIPHALSMNPCFVCQESWTGDLWAVASLMPSDKRRASKVKVMPSPQAAVSIYPPHPRAPVLLTSGITHPIPTGNVDKVTSHDYQQHTRSTLVPSSPGSSHGDHSLTRRANYTFLVDENGEHPPHEGCANSLSCLQDTTEKPCYIAHVPLRAAILGSPDQRLTLPEIYLELMKKFPYYAKLPSAAMGRWKQSIRHNLSVLRCFVKIERQSGGLGYGSHWIVDLDAIPTDKKPPLTRSNGAGTLRGPPTVQVYGYPVPLSIPGTQTTGAQPDGEVREVEGPSLIGCSSAARIASQEQGIDTSPVKSRLYAPPTFWY